MFSAIKVTKVAWDSENPNIEPTSVFPACRSAGVLGLRANTTKKIALLATLRIIVQISLLSPLK